MKVAHNSEKFAPVVKTYLDMKAHTVSSFTFLGIAFGTFIYWIIQTFFNKGEVFYTFHGVGALVSIISVLLAAITGIKKNGTLFSSEIHTKIANFFMWTFVGVMVVGYIILL